MNATIQYSTRSNIKSVITETWVYSKLLFLFYGLVTTCTVVQLFLGIFIPKFILDELTSYHRASHLSFLLISMFIIASVASFLNAYLQHLSKTEVMKVTFKFIHKITEKNLVTAFKDTEDPIFLNKMESAKRTLHDTNNGLQGILNRLFSLGGSVIALMGYMTIIFTTIDGEV